MEQFLLEKLPLWFCDLEPKRFYLVLSDDMDSYYSCRILQKFTGLSISGFYSFEHGLYLDTKNTHGKEPVFVDLSISQGKTFDNHFTFIENPQAINPNVIKRPYYMKYNGGTLPLVASLYDHLYDYSELQWMTILAVDSFYYGYYNRDGAFRNINLFWFKQLGISDYVIPILERKTADNFLQFIRMEGLNESIYINN